MYSNVSHRFPELGWSGSIIHSIISTPLMKDPPVEGLAILDLNPGAITDAAQNNIQFPYP